MDVLLNAIANFITNHWFLVFLILLLSPPRLFTINIQKKEKEESKEKEVKNEVRNVGSGD